MYQYFAQNFYSAVIKECVIEKKKMDKIPGFFAEVSLERPAVCQYMGYARYLFISVNGQFRDRSQATTRELRLPFDPQCGPNEKPCGGFCTNITTDENCGDCGIVCPVGQSCHTDRIFGITHCGFKCPPGSTICSGFFSDYCANLQTNPNNCGGCGNVCDSGNCIGGQCQPCPSGSQLCHGRCLSPADLNSDPNNCGRCDRSCPINGGFCSNGGCRSPSGQSYCIAGGIEYCADTTEDRQNCGFCGISVLKMKYVKVVHVLVVP